MSDEIRDFVKWLYHIGAFIDYGEEIGDTQCELLIQEFEEFEAGGRGERQ